MNSRDEKDVTGTGGADEDSHHQTASATDMNSDERPPWLDMFAQEVVKEVYEKVQSANMYAENRSAFKFLLLDKKWRHLLTPLIVLAAILVVGYDKVQQEPPPEPMVMVVGYDQSHGMYRMLFDSVKILGSTEANMRRFFLTWFVQRKERYWGTNRQLIGADDTHVSLFASDEIAKARLDTAKALWDEHGKKLKRYVTKITVILDDDGFGSGRAASRDPKEEYWAEIEYEVTEVQRKSQKKVQLFVARVVYTHVLTQDLNSPLPPKQAALRNLMNPGHIYIKDYVEREVLIPEELDTDDSKENTDDGQSVDQNKYGYAFPSFEPDLDSSGGGEAK